MFPAWNRRDGLRQHFEPVGSIEADGGIMLALHNDGFAVLYRRVCAAFYEELVGVVRNCAPGEDRRGLLLRVRLITAIWDGAQLQVLHGSSSRTFLTSIADQVVAMAKAP